MLSKSFSVLTVSKRIGWEEAAMRSVMRQYKHLPDCQWIIVSEFPQPKSMVGLPGIEWVRAPEQVRASNLNASLNEGLRHIKRKYVIFYQDFIELPENCFEKLLSIAENKDNKGETFVTTCTPNYDGTDDSRYTGTDKVRQCAPQEWEANVALAPMRAIRELGGFEEELDNGWSWDNVNLAERADILGYRFLLDESNRPKLLPHELTSKLELELNAERHERIMQEIHSGVRPLKAPYL